jgi:hypothetical protein
VAAYRATAKAQKIAEERRFMLGNLSPDRGAG